MGYMDVPCFHFASGTQTIYTSEIQKTLKKEKIMTREDIEKAAVNYDSRAVAFRAYVAGAEWRINSVWHDASEKPDTDKGDLLVIVKDAFGKDVYVRQNAYYVLKYGCVRWAYIKDLIPDTELNYE